MKKLTVAAMSAILALTLTVPGAFASESTSAKLDISAIATKKIAERVQLGHDDFVGVTIGKTIGMKDENEQVTKTLVVLQRGNEVAGYFVIDNEKGLLLEFATGSVYPGQGENEGNLYYFGPLFYANKINDTDFKDLKTKKSFNKKVLAEVKSKKDKAKSILEPSPAIAPPAENGEVGTNTIINYEYGYINGVPDYQQNDNPSMDNDCVPTSGANTIMYWRGQGYTALSSSGIWTNVADRLGVLMKHNNTYGVYSSDIAPGLNAYFKEKGYTNFSTTRDTSPTFGEMKTEVNAKSPGFLRLEHYGYIPEGSDGGHLVNLVGYETYTQTDDWSNPQYAIVHDNWKTTGTDVYLLLGQYGSITDMWKVRD
ncbi:C39 family peptidase [Paenibacillus cellulositrophicus]|uniref:C39 family peptidase n=1 Tax=Paenibacillus cellulositrophicus TaxID=562959 RepID=UPI00142ED092|nr:C39 family peptidase [Paenibacillus cellulositrophicus]